MATRRKFLFNHNQIVTFCQELETQKAETLSVQLLEIKDLELERRWPQLVASYDPLILEDDKEEHDYNDVNGQKFEEACAKYQKCKESIMIAICSKTNSQQENSVDHIPPQRSAPSLKLPPCDTPPFEGDTLNAQKLYHLHHSQAIFKSYDKPVDNWDPILIHIVSSKIPDDTLRAWEDSLSNHKELPSWQQMDSFLLNRIEKLETVLDFRKPNTRENQNSKSQSFHISATNQNLKTACKKCNQNHWLMYCKQFKDLSPTDRTKFAMENKYCLNCLSPNHFKSDCISKRRCAKCKRKHHTMLHIDSKRDQTQGKFHENGSRNPTQDGPSTSKQAHENTFLNTTEPVEEVNTLFSQNESTTVLPTARIFLEHGGELFAVRALLDAGSERSFISKRVQQRLAIPMETHNAQISGLGGTDVSSCKGKCILTVKAPKSDFKIIIKALVVSSLAHLLPSRPIKTTLLNEVKGLNLADPFFHKPAPIDMIIGSDYLPFINKTGSFLQIGGLENLNLAGICQLQQFWELEEVEKPQTESDTDTWCENFYKSTTYRQNDGRYVVRLPFKQEYPHEIFLGSSLHMAFAQYVRVEKNLSKTPELKHEYDKVLREYEELGHMALKASPQKSAWWSTRRKRLPLSTTFFKRRSPFWADSAARPGEGLTKLANWVLSYPQASQILQHEVYVDDVLSGAHSIAEAKTKQDQLVKALSSAGFPPKKLTSNSKALLQSWPREDLLDEEFLNIENHSAMKTFGIRWNAMTDSFYYNAEPIEVTLNVTKRKILSAIARLFDPLGWLGPTIVIAKILMQDLWSEKLGWDDDVTSSILKRWSSFAENLQKVSDVRIQRWVQFAPRSSVQFHGFSDASEKAYCAAVYIRVLGTDGNIHVNLLVSKTKVAPIKKTTIPKLELCGAELLSRLIQQVIKDVDFEYELFLWTDSSIVLGWLQKSPQTLKTFVANRVSNILNVVNVSQWNYVKTDENPADLGSRGCAPQDLSSSQLWWHGPSWLKQPREMWPKPRTFEPTDLEVKRVATFHTTIDGEDIISRFSSLNRCLRVLCYMFRFFITHAEAEHSPVVMSYVMKKSNL
ncbi:uncharacterized protein LOC142224780 [Haematobia irritans]|uniref:uncharacterized protein LOC142224780 n=1 Tax=Haematobia irritans TaxID=7368 RepID=UPI003F5015DD